MAIVTRTLHQLPFDQLDPHRFEDLLRQLAYDFRPWRSLEATGRSGNESGYDARGYERVASPDADDRGQTDGEDEGSVQTEIGEDRLWLIQAKREKSITPKKMEKYLSDVPADEAKLLYGIIIGASCEFSKTTRDVVAAWCRTNGLSEYHLWGRADLEDQLYQPKNDRLLFAYFGISLQIRTRSMRTALRAKLAMKRKCDRHLTEHERILIRDPSDDRYPFKPADGEAPMGWMVEHVHSLHPLGLVVAVSRHLAYIAENDQWDFVEDIDTKATATWEDPWQGNDDQDWQRQQVAQVFWNGLKYENRAWLTKIIMITYDKILEIDEKGDAAARFPHVYVADIHHLKTRLLIEPLDRTISDGHLAEAKDRITFFPREFPEPAIPVEQEKKQDGWITEEGS